jgi:PAS domain S-box-containing protein
MKISDITGALGDHVRDAIVISEAEPADLPGPRIVWVNQAFTDMTGYTPEEAIGKSPRILQGPDTDPEVRNRIREGLKAWRPIREVLKNYTKSGEPFWVELDIKPIADSSGWYHYWVAVQRDVTAHVERQHELDEARLEAEAASQLKSEFLANMSHEIRTPLNGALGMAQVLRMTNLDARQRRAVETIISSGQSLLSLIEDILDLSKIEAGRLQLEPLPTTARSLIEAAGEAVRGLVVQKGLVLRLETGDGSDTPFLIDPRRTRQLLINLAGNAAKFTESGQVVLSSQRDGDVMVFQIRDSGPGIPPEKRAMIFDRFQQADGSHTRAHDGAGLGLAIVKQLVLAAGGEVSVKDAPEGGACFEVRLPFTPAEAPHTAARESEPAGDGRRALLVEDNPINREVVVEALGMAGWRVDCAASAEPGLEAWRAGAYDLVVMDKQMPGMSGEEAIAKMRAEEIARAQSRTPILMLTAHAMADTEDQAVKAGADAFMTKPFEVPRLLELADTLARRAC